MQVKHLLPTALARVDHGAKTVRQALLAGQAGRQYKDFSQNVPMSFVAFREGIMVFRQAGALPPAALEDLITQIAALDMDKVRASIATETAGTR